MSDTITESPAETKPDSPDIKSEFFWYELMTSDQDAAVDFYTKVVGWTAAEQQAGDSGFRYVVLSVGQRGIGGVLQLTDEMKAGGARPGWVGYIHVDDVDAKARSIAEAGGRILMPAKEIPNVGRFAMVADPGGAPFYVMNPKPAPGAHPGPMPPADTPGVVGWRELYSPLGDQGAFDFYSGQFGWESLAEFDMGGTMGIYRIFGIDGVQMGGMMKQPDNIPASFWNFYVSVDGIDAAAERVKAGGGQIVMGPQQVPGGSWVLQGLDPQGAGFALISLTK